MYSRITASSSPTVLTQYPRDQKFNPTKFLFRPYLWWAMIADFPFSLPIVLATLYFGGIPRHLGT